MIQKAKISSRSLNRYTKQITEMLYYLAPGDSIQEGQGSTAVAVAQHLTFGHCSLGRVHFQAKVEAERI